MKRLGGVLIVLGLVLAQVAPVSAQDDESFWVSDVAWSPDGSLLAVATSGSMIVPTLEFWHSGSSLEG